MRRGRRDWKIGLGSSGEGKNPPSFMRNIRNHWLGTATQAQVVNYAFLCFRTRRHESRIVDSTNSIGLRLKAWEAQQPTVQ